MKEEKKEFVVEFEIKKSMKLNIGDYESYTTEINIKQQLLTDNIFENIEQYNLFTDQLMREQYIKSKNISKKIKDTTNLIEKIEKEEEKENEAN